MDFVQSMTSVFSLIAATPSDLITVRNTAFLISQQEIAKNAGDSPAARKAYTPGPRKFFKPLVIAGPSGAGKGTLINFIKAKFPDRFGFSVSTTTRAPRKGEVN